MVDKKTFPTSVIAKILEPVQASRGLEYELENTTGDPLQSTPSGETRDSPAPTAITEFPVQSRSETPKSTGLLIQVTPSMEL